MSSGSINGYLKRMSEVEKYSCQWFDLAFLLFCCLGDSILVPDNEESLEYNDYFQALLGDFIEDLKENYTKTSAVGNRETIS